MISDSFHRYVKTTPKGEARPDRRKIVTVIKQSQRDGKLFRFWGTPDTPEMWANLLKWNVDLISTDKVNELADFLEAR